MTRWRSRQQQRQRQRQRRVILDAFSSCLCTVILFYFFLISTFIYFSFNVVFFSTFWFSDEQVITMDNARAQWVWNTHATCVLSLWGVSKPHEYSLASFPMKLSAPLKALLSSHTRVFDHQNYVLALGQVRIYPVIHACNSVYIHIVRSIVYVPFRPPGGFPMRFVCLHNLRHFSR